MRGHHWEPGEAKIVEVGAGPAGRYGLHSEYYYVVDARTPAGATFRGTVIHKSSDSLGVGTIVRVEVNSKTGEIRLDSRAGAGVVVGMSVAEQVRANAAAFDNNPTSGLAGPDGPRWQMRMTPAAVHVVAAGGQEIVLDESQQAEMSQLTQALLGSDPVAKRAAVERLRQIKMQMAGQAGTPATAMPAGGWQATGQVAGGGAHTVQDRLAVLQHLLDQGVLTQPEFEAQRQRIINDI